MTKLSVGDMEPRNAEPSEWKRPDQVMQLHRLKLKKRALQARIKGTSIENRPSNEQTNLPNEAGKSTLKRKNPFAREDLSKKQKNISVELEASNDNTLFELLRFDAPKSKAEDAKYDLSFSSVLAKLDGREVKEHKEPEVPVGEKHIPMDWTLHTKMRFMSPKPFAWTSKLKTSEEASGTTGFVRCLDIGDNETTLDTTPNARFHQCCLVWQHPSLPWLQLFPRSTGRVTSSLGSSSPISNNQLMKDALFREWSDSFRSLFHLLRARQCPYFYVCANTFMVLFRAAGICGLPEIHALLTPTTHGFRQALKQEEIEFTMPLRKNGKRRSDGDSGCDTLDSTSTLASESLTADQEEDEEPEEQWLQSLGIEDSEIKKMSSVQTRITLEKESVVDSSKHSLVFVQGVEAQALFNFLINCKSAVPSTGNLAGIPPTLLSPVAFNGATLKSLKVRESIVRDDKDRYYSLELRGPLLPHVMPSLCHLMKSSQLERFSVSCAQLSSTTSFSLARHGQEQPEDEKLPVNIFAKENLSDCGFNKELLSHFCNPDPSAIEVLDSLKYSNDLYVWS